METKDLVLLAVTLIILGEVSYLLAKLPRTKIKTSSRAILVDTSVLMDGRITSIAPTGFIGGTLVVPRSVIGELQFLADHADSDKRARARHGLDVVSELQAMPEVEVEILQDGSKAEEGVDERLLTLAKVHQAVICTLDYNLNKVAVVESIKVLNINELAQSLRMQVLPGEQVMINLIQKGQENHQAVGYMPDGTMVVVEHANKMIGQSVLVEAVRSLQTAAGKMMFAKIVDPKAKSLSSDSKQHVKSKHPRSLKSAVRSIKLPNKPVSKNPNNQTNTEVTKSNASNVKPPAPQQTKPSAQRPPTQKPSTQKPSNRNRRNNHEENLLSLVASQKD